MILKRGPVVTAIAFAFLACTITVGAYLSWDRIVFLSKFEFLGTNEQGFREYRHRKTGIVFVALPGGQVEIGTRDDQVPSLVEAYVAAYEASTPEFAAQCVVAEQPCHLVTLRPFLIGKYEVTQGNWRQVMPDWEDWIQDTEWIDDLPIVLVAWNDCQEFCRRTGLRLLAEAEWEYACKGGKESEDFRNPGIEETAWFKENSGGDRHPVGLKAPNGFGLFDMQGNVLEVCEDAYRPGGYARSSTDGSPNREYVGWGYVIRGGSYHSDALWCRCSARPDWGTGGERYSNSGFRVGFSLP